MLPRLTTSEMHVDLCYENMATFSLQDGQDKIQQTNALHSQQVTIIFIQRYEVYVCSIYETVDQL
jgi:hypothetical protein